MRENKNENIKEKKKSTTAVHGKYRLEIILSNRHYDLAKYKIMCPLGDLTR